MTIEIGSTAMSQANTYSTILATGKIPLIAILVILTFQPRIQAVIAHLELRRRILSIIGDITRPGLPHVATTDRLV